MSGVRFPSPALMSGISLEPHFGSPFQAKVQLITTIHFVVTYHEMGQESHHACARSALPPRTSCTSPAEKPESACKSTVAPATFTWASTAHRKATEVPPPAGQHLGTGQYGSPAGRASVSSAADGEWTVAMLAVKYDDFASSHYVKDGRPTDQRYRAAIEPLVQLFGDTLARDFGPKRFQALREHIIRRGSLWTAPFDAQGNLARPGQPLSRDYLNNLMKAVACMFKWAVTEEKVPPSVPDALAKVGGLRKGRDSRVREPEPVRPVPLEHFWPVVKAASPPIAAMLQVQRSTGMRPDEVTIMRPCDLDRTGDVWTYRPESHKLEWLDQNKEVLIGPKAQQVLAPWLENAAPDQYLFSPRRTAEWNARELENDDAGRARVACRLSRKRAPRDHYDDRG